jgi:hypothetical protein
MESCGSAEIAKAVKSRIEAIFNRQKRPRPPRTLLRCLNGRPAAADAFALSERPPGRRGRFCAA